MKRPRTYQRAAGGASRLALAATPPGDTLPHGVGARPEPAAEPTARAPVSIGMDSTRAPCRPRNMPMTRRTRNLAATAATLAIAGCAQLPAVPFHGDALLDETRAALDTRPQRIELAPAARPTLQRGDAFVFGRSTVPRVAATSPQTLTWTLPDGRSLRCTRDFFAPALSADHPGRHVDSTI